MARFNFRIGTKLGLTAGIGVVLVAGMLVSQLVGNQSIALLSGWVIINTSNKANSQATESAVLRAQLAALEISGATSVGDSRPPPKRNKKASSPTAPIWGSLR
jgi:hypothetical protein